MPSFLLISLNNGLHSLFGLLEMTHCLKTCQLGLCKAEAKSLTCGFTHVMKQI